VTIPERLVSAGPGATVIEPLQVLIVAAYPAVRAGLAALLARDAVLRTVEAVPGPVSADGWSTTRPGAAPVAVVVDLAGMPDGIADDLMERYPDAALVLLGADPAVDGPGIGAGPVAYLAHDVDAPSLVAAVRGVTAGLTILDPALIAVAGIHARAALGNGTPGSGPGDALTARERQVLELVATGLPNKAIARELGISEHTAKFHVGSLLAKLGAASRTEAVTLATRRGLLTV
jgi:two-component system nitrate/nitrite response regulator NarL